VREGFEKNGKVERTIGKSNRMRIVVITGCVVKKGWGRGGPPKKFLYREIQRRKTGGKSNGCPGKMLLSLAGQTLMCGTGGEKKDGSIWSVRFFSCRWKEKNFNRASSKVRCTHREKGVGLLNGKAKET